MFPVYYLFLKKVILWIKNTYTLNDINSSQNTPIKIKNSGYFVF